MVMMSKRDLRSLPKAHLHLHLEGAMRQSTLIERAAYYGVPCPPVDVIGSFTEFSQIYNVVCAVLRTDDDLRRLVREVVEDAAIAGAIWLEAAVRPRLHGAKFGGGDREVLEILLDEARSAGEEFGVGVGLLMTVDRTQPLEVAWDEAALAAAYSGKGVVSFGLANDEEGHPPDPFIGPFDMARGAGLLSCPHAGELDGPRSVWSALDLLGADRIQHGIRAIEDPLLVNRLASESICLDVCPTSNVLLKVVSSMAEHPLPFLLDAGVPCSLNADDPLFFGATLLDEYEISREVLGLSDEQVARIAKASIESSAASKYTKAAACEGITAWLSDGSLKQGGLARGNDHTDR
jgi:adenosine deaminase